ncbi:MAG: hypothetical protein ACREQP_19655 [Candidatus Binatia bacterium]
MTHSSANQRVSCARRGVEKDKFCILYHCKEKPSRLGRAAKEIVLHKGTFSDTLSAKIVCRAASLSLMAARCALAQASCRRFKKITASADL